MRWARQWAVRSRLRRVISGVTGSASALKMAYAAWTKGSAALLLAQLGAARAHGVADELASEWRLSLPELDERVAAAERSAAAKGWRWVAEMEEIAATFAAAGEPDGSTSPPPTSTGATDDEGGSRPPSRFLWERRKGYFFADLPSIVA